MNKGIQRFIPIIFIIVIVALLIAAAFSVVRIFTGGNSNESSEVADTSNQALLSNTSERSVRMTVRGEIVGDETFRSYRVTVTPTSRVFTRYKGYLEEPLVSKTYENNIKAYDEFVYALSRANLTKGEALTGDADDTRGICSDGVLYEFEILNGASSVKRLWTSTCGGSKGSLTADAEYLQALFLAQVPDAQQYIGKD
jgi:hypothetical protein